MADEGHIATELIIRETEADVSRVYRQAAEETQKKLDAYLQRFKAKDAVKRAKLSAGEITRQEYDYWRTGQIAIGERWEEMRSTLAQDYHNANMIARSIVVSHMPEAYAVNHNYATFQIEKESMLNTSYTLYDRQTVERIIRDQPDLLPAPGPQMKKTFADFDAYKQGQTGHITAKERKAFDKLIDSGKDIRWQKGKIQSVMTQSILQGESVPNMARRVAREMGEINRKSTTRYVRTAMTGAQNAGRVDAYARAQSMGIELEQEWLATLDRRTRHSHRKMDGEVAKVGDTFSNHCEYPGDPAGPPEEIWNCRCTLIPHVKGIDQSDAPRDSRLEDMTYDEWKHEHEREQTTVENYGSYEGVVQGQDITSTWTRRPDQFDFEIEDVLSAQGFDGKPRIVDQEEFDRAVRAANDGNGFIAQRTYSAPDQATLDAYREQLYDGRFYVDCSTGGAQYGQGMYCAADYTGTLSDGIKSEMEHYVELQDSRIGYNPSQAIVDAQYKYADEQRQMIIDSVTDPKEQAVLRSEFLYSPTKEDRRIIRSLSEEEYDSIFDRMKAIKETADQTHSDIIHMDRGKIAEMLHIPEHAPHYVETFTLDPSAKIITWKEVDRMMSLDKEHDFEWFKSIGWDEGVYAAMKGYDAINAVGHGKSGSYTVILNRTKLIILGNE